MTSLQAFSPSGSDKLTSRQFPIPVVLDSGTTLSYLPTDLAVQVWNEVGAVYSPEIDMAVLPCKMKTSKGFFSFGFAGPSGPKINVTMDELVLDLTTGPAPTFTSGQGFSPPPRTEQAPSPAPSPEAESSDDESKPRKTGWWSKKVFGDKG